MNVVFIIPTGIGAEIGGHAGDGNAVAKLFASTCDNLITHPNVVNASDINEMTDNTLYVEGSMLDRFLEGKIELEKVKSNKILVVTNHPLNTNVVNSVSAGRVTLGIDASILVLNTPLRMIGKIKNNKAGGDVSGWKELIKQVKQYEFDALAITTLIEVERKAKLHYFRNGGINPWGGVEAIASKLISEALNKPVAHSPVGDVEYEDKELYVFNEIVDPRMSAEIVSVSYFHCVLKGLHKAPRIGKGLSVKDVDVMISPYGCFGRPHQACVKHNIPIIIVKENKTSLHCFNKSYKNLIYVENYLEAVGIVMAMKTGITIESIRRPIQHTKIIK